jgi:succinyl-CoA synthetase beta subunit
MNLLEYQAKVLLSDRGLPVPQSWLVKPSDSTPEGVVFPVVAKSQVPVGGRGKAGGIVSVESTTTLPETLERIFALSIKGYTPSAVLLEEELSSARELYLSLRLNRDTRQVEWLASPQGGIEIEDNAASVKIITYSTDDSDDALASILGVQRDRLAPILSGIEQTFFESDLLLCEINPLIETNDGRLICADAKCLVDDNARFRHPELPWPPSEGNVPKPLGGNIGCIANGAGMAMSTMDTIVATGGRPANFLDIGGGTGEKEFVVALKNIMELPDVTSIIVNIFAGISRCDEIARGIIAAREQLPGLPPLFIRLEGTNRDIAVELLNEAQIAIEPDLKSCVKKAMEVGA